MNITIKVASSGEEFTLYGIDFVPEPDDRIIREGSIYRVLRRTWNDDNSETILDVGLISVIPENATDDDVIALANKGQLLAAIKLYKEIHDVGLKEAKDWVDNHR